MTWIVDRTVSVRSCVTGRRGDWITTDAPRGLPAAHSLSFYFALATFTGVAPQRWCHGGCRAAVESGTRTARLRLPLARPQRIRGRALFLSAGAEGAGRKRHIVQLLERVSKLPAPSLPHRYVAFIVSRPERSEVKVSAPCKHQANTSAVVSRVRVCF